MLVQMLSSWVRKDLTKPSWRASRLRGKIRGVSGYVLSRYSAMRRESAMYDPVEGSWMAGRV